jgi:hypothetical protein
MKNFKKLISKSSIKPEYIYIYISKGIANTQGGVLAI